MLNKTWFEIGQIIHLDQYNNETRTVFSSKSLIECLKEWKKQGYKKSDYFIDIWSKTKNGTPYPIVEININQIDFNEIENF